MFNLMLITSNPELASYAEGSGVSRIFVDLEINGKYERQGGLDTVISCHTINDVRNVRSVLKKSELLVRINPYHDGSRAEIEEVIAAGADMIMLPMFREVGEIEAVTEIISNRVRFIPLVETKDAMHCLQSVVQVEGVSEIYIGLNDLHRDLSMDFIFEPLAIGLVDNMAKIICQAGLKFGFGGVARIGEGDLPAEKILAEHARLGSSCVILSRTFHRRSESVSDVQAFMSLENEVGKILRKREGFKHRNADEVTRDSVELKEIVKQIIARKNEKTL